MNGILVAVAVFTKVQDELLRCDLGVHHKLPCGDQSLDLRVQKLQIHIAVLEVESGKTFPYHCHFH